MDATETVESSAKAMKSLESWLVQQWQHRGVMAYLLWPLSWVYGLLLKRYQRQMIEALPSSFASSPAVPVIVVGNKIAGGAGKTPTVICVVEWLKAQGYQPGIISRGYQRKTSENHSARPVHAVSPSSAASLVGDEPVLLARTTQVPVYVGRQRTAVMQTLLKQHPDVNIIVSDDGLQHLSLARDIDIIVFDKRGVGNGWLLPAGPMREPLLSPVTSRHQLIVYTQGQQSTALPGYIGHRQLRGLTPLDAWAAGERQTSSFADWRHLTLNACAGIATPETFFQALRQVGLTLVHTYPVPDHYDFHAIPWPDRTAFMIVTEKDATKLMSPSIRSLIAPQTQILVAPLDFEIEPPFFDALARALHPSL